MKPKPYNEEVDEIPYRENIKEFHQSRKEMLIKELEGISKFRYYDKSDEDEQKMSFNQAIDQAKRLVEEYM